MLILKNDVLLFYRRIVLKHIVIAIDGPAASGKSTVAKLIARELNYLYVDSGALYRGVTWAGLSRGIKSTDYNSILAMLDEHSINFFVSEGSVSFSIDGKIPGKLLRTAVVNNNVSLVATHKKIRLRLVGWLREMVRFGSLVMEGRDIGTKVFANADIKIYLDASKDERTRRRYMEDIEALNINKVGESLIKRDLLDSNREADPLRMAPDAHLVNTTKLPLKNVVSHTLDIIKNEISLRGE